MNLRGQALSTAFHNPVREFLNTYPGNYLEVGVYQGHFLATLCSEYQDKSFFGIDPFISDGCVPGERGSAIPEIEEIAKHNILQVANGTLIKCTTQDFLKSDIKDSILEKVSCILIDGSHHYEDIIYDLELVLSISNNFEKAVFFDDMAVPDVAKGAKELISKLENRVNRLSQINNGYIIHFK
jgi:hypothetical protein